MPLTIQTKNKSNKGGKEPFAKETHVTYLLSVNSNAKQPWKHNRSFEQIALPSKKVKLQALPAQLTLIRFTIKLMLRIPEKSVDW